MAGFSNTPPASEFRRATSWGRTRGPKNLTGAQGASATVLVSTAAPSAATDGYATENQRYLHLLLDTDTDGQTVTITVWAYSHAFGSWGALTGVTAAAAVTAADAKKHQVFEISGVDRVYFRSTGGNAFDGNDKLYAACSTF